MIMDKKIEKIENIKCSQCNDKALQVKAVNDLTRLACMALVWTAFVYVQLPSQHTITPPLPTISSNV